MSAPLPRVFEESAGGKAVPVPSAPGQSGNIGGDFRVDEVMRVSKETVWSCLAHFLRAAVCMQTLCHVPSMWPQNMESSASMLTVSSAYGVWGAVKEAGGGGACAHGALDNGVHHSAGVPSSQHA